jgi:Thiamine pyrophosphate enzyme, C-terminal TPP binding domain
MKRTLTGALVGVLAVELGAVAFEAADDARVDGAGLGADPLDGRLAACDVEVAQGSCRTSPWWATELVNPDFVALARAYGAHGELVTRTADFVPAFERAVASGLPAIIEARTDPRRITTRASLPAVSTKKS